MSFSWGLELNTALEGPHSAQLLPSSCWTHWLLAHMDTPGLMSSHCWPASLKPCPGPLWHLTPSWRSPTESPHAHLETLHIPMLLLSCHCLHPQTLLACPSHPSRIGKGVTATTGNALPKYPRKQIIPGWQTVGCLMPTKATPSAGQERENMMLLSWDKNRERPLSSYCYGQETQFEENDGIYYQSDW